MSDMTSSGHYANVRNEVLFKSVHLFSGFLYWCNTSLAGEQYWEVFCKTGIFELSLLFPFLTLFFLFEIKTKQITCSKVWSSLCIHRIFCSEVWPFIPTGLLFSRKCDQSHFGERKFSREVRREGRGKSRLKTYSVEIKSTWIGNLD